MMIMEKVLEILQRSTETAISVASVFLSTYKDSYRKMKHGENFQFKTDWADEYRNHQRFYNLLNKLKKEGLVKNKKQGRTSLWTITKVGLRKLKNLQSGRIGRRPFTYEKQKDNTLRIISFDIPEYRRRQRDWLRNVINNLGFEMLHKSVWIGKIKIPEELLHELRKQSILRYIHILKIDKQGTVEKTF